MRTLAKLTWVEMKLFFREPITVIFSLAFPLVMLLVAVKGFGWAAIGLLSLFIIASLFLVWRRFTSVAL